MLVLARLVTDDISSLWSPTVSNAEPQRDRLPSDYRTNLNLRKKRIHKKAIESALDAAKGKLTAAAERLGIGHWTMAAALRHHHIHLPLSEFTSKQLGAKRINAIREALAYGVPKSKVQRQFGVSAWSILLIELDRPSLDHSNREAAAARKREKHRDVLLSFLRNSPDKPRSEFADRHPGSYSWLRIHDRAWFQSRLPVPRWGHRKGKQKVLKNHPLDLAASLSVRQMALQELAKHDRPMRLTRTRLLLAVGARSALSERGRDRNPLTIAEVERAIETKEQFLRRTIRWALNELARGGKTISMNQLCRTAGLESRHLIDNRIYIIEVATELNLQFDARCALAP